MLHSKNISFSCNSIEFIELHENEVFLNSNCNAHYAPLDVILSPVWTYMLTCGDTSVGTGNCSSTGGGPRPSAGSPSSSPGTNNDTIRKNNTANDTITKLSIIYH